MALRATGKRSVALRRATLKIGDRLTRAPDKHAARVGREVCKALSG